ncbi:hypothetical protein QBC41DRAFT_300719 [Cercophora samala]|uniref:J domain-containing protein n=1 Tax=Cercophora samala TaxID=330535 RepID=A0AA39ZHU4_9PEZI|nr:hypothetical protein QBC41DRAFT_300719 [Cercophora samala]
MISEPLNLYRQLGARPSDDDAAVRGAFKRKTLEKHPDKHNNSTEAKKEFQELQRAHDILTNPIARREYHINVMQRILRLGNLKHQSLSWCHRAAAHELPFRKQLFSISFQTVQRLRYTVRFYQARLNAERASFNAHASDGLTKTGHHILEDSVSVRQYQQIYDTSVEELAEAQRELAERAMAVRAMEWRIRLKMREIEHCRREVEGLQHEYIQAAPRQASWPMTFMNVESFVVQKPTKETGRRA